jgi:histidyl-tRNA synthetase
MDTNPIGVLDSKVDGPKLVDAPAPVDHLAPEDEAHFAAVRSGLERRGIPTTPAPRLVRGLDYYNRTVFEYVPRGYEAAQTSVGGGGRYDGLAELLGGPPVPGMGLAMGVDRILLALGEAEAAGALDLYVVVSDETRHREAEAVVDQARAAGLRADRDLSHRSVKAQFRAAERLGAAVVAVVGDEPDGGAVLTDRRDGGRETVPGEEVTTWIRNR